MSSCLGWASEVSESSPDEQGGVSLPGKMEEREQMCRRARTAVSVGEAKGVLHCRFQAGLGGRQGR